MSRLVVYGDALIDIWASVEALPERGEDAIVETMRFLPGGSAANCAAVASRLGADVSFVGMVGQDTFGDEVRQDLAAHGVDVSTLRQIDGPTGIVIALVDSGGQPTFVSYQGAAVEVPPGPPPVEVLQSGDHLHISGYSLQVEGTRRFARTLMAAAQEIGASVSIDPSHNFALRVREDYPDVLEGLDILLPNEAEARLMTGLDDPAKAASRLHELGVQTVVLKQGAEGSLLSTEEGMLHVPAYPVEVVDATGAGDAFAGGLLTAAQKGASLESAVRVGHVAAALVIGEIGGHTAAPTVAQAEAFAQAQGDTHLQEILGRLSKTT